jgi:hypothetical protein
MADKYGTDKYDETWVRLGSGDRWQRLPEPRIVMSYDEAVQKYGLKHIPHCRTCTCQPDTATGVSP